MKPHPITVILFVTALLCACSGFASAQMKFERLPATVTSHDGEVVPVISPDGRALYFARPRKALDNSTVVDIWRSEIDSNGQYALPEFIGGNLASRFGIEVISVSPGENTLYLYGLMQQYTPEEDRIYVTQRQADGWSVPTSIRIENLRLHHTAGTSPVTDFAFGADQKTLIMAVDRDSSMGGQDLYVSFFDEQKDSWSQPLWLGPALNSAYSEVTPFLAADNKTLYFSSNRPGGYGDIDVYRSVRLDNSWQHWSLPEDLGLSVNRPGRTTYYTEDAQGKNAYFVWRASTAEHPHIYRVPVSRQKANPVVLLEGRVLDDSGHALKARIRYERLSDGVELGTAHSEPSTGAYQIALPAGERYAIRAEKKGFIPHSENLDLTALADFQSMKRDLVLSAIKAGVVVRLNNIFFETDKATLLPDSFAELNRLDQLLTSDSAMRISIEGHTDSVGSAEHNTTLSKNRAMAVKEYLTKLGIVDSRLEVKAYGPAKPIAPNTTDEGRAQNRRVEFRILRSSAVKPAENGSVDN